MEEAPEFQVVLLLVVEPTPVFIHGGPPALADRLAAAENELARLQADRKLGPIGGVVVSNIPERIAAIAARLTAALNAGAKRRGTARGRSWETGSA